MNRQQREPEPIPKAHEEPGASIHLKKTYESPRIQDWGSITDLTQGLKVGLEDFPVVAGTRDF